MWPISRNSLVRLPYTFIVIPKGEGLLRQSISTNAYSESINTNYICGRLKFGRMRASKDSETEWPNGCLTEREQKLTGVNFQAWPDVVN